MTCESRCVLFHRPLLIWISQIICLAEPDIQALRSGESHCYIVLLLIYSPSLASVLPFTQLLCSCCWIWLISFIFSAEGGELRDYRVLSSVGDGPQIGFPCHCPLVMVQQAMKASCENVTAKCTVGQVWLIHNSTNISHKLLWVWYFLGLCHSKRTHTIYFCNEHNSLFICHSTLFISTNFPCWESE